NPALQTLHADLSIDPTAGVAGGLAGATALAGPSGPVMAPSSEAALARYGLGLAFRQRGYFREARAEFARALAHGEDARLVRHALAELDLLDGASSAARERYETLLAEEETARWWNEHGVALHQAGEVDGAADSYRRALRLDPRHALAYNNLGVALAERRDSSGNTRPIRTIVSIWCVGALRWLRIAVAAIAMIFAVPAFTTHHKR
ncbi:MAG: tetratricopeptide repeat protein, partial [Gemmatimonadaceae bacterium]